MQQVKYGNKGITPSKIVCIGRNYVEHAEELGNAIPDNPIVFIKPNSAIAQQVHFQPDENVQYEGELSFLIDKGQAVAVALGIDFTKRNLQQHLKKKGLPWELAKAFNGSAVFSPFVDMPDEFAGLSFEFYVNQQIRQRGELELMINQPDYLITYIQQYFHLQDGDIVMTGTPRGVGGFVKGDELSGTVFHNGRELVSANWLVG